MLRFCVNTDVLADNMTALKKLTKAKICAVVKADAYGHGLGAIESFSKADEFAVATVSEALELTGITDKPINILSAPDMTVACGYCEAVIPSVSTVDEIRFVASNGAGAVNLAVNTGMNRFGASVGEIGDLLREAEKTKLSVKSVYSHIYGVFAAQMQFERFMKSTESYTGYIPQRHLLSSNFTVLPEYMHLDMVRPGLVLYGYGHETVRSALSVKCGVLQLRDVSPIDNVGYGECLSGKVRRLAVLGAGYADGCRRIFADTPRYVEINGCLCQIVGQVCMDAAIADVSGLDVKVGDYAYLIGDLYGAEAVAASCGTICYEILTGFGKRVVREYHGSKR